MRLALVADEYSPARTSVAVQMQSLAHELASQGHAVTVIVPAAGLTMPWSLRRDDGVEVLRLRAPRTKDRSYARRALAEYRLPYIMKRGIRTSPLATTRWDGIAWYSPTIFMGPLINWLKKRSGCNSYLILRDLFPDWAVDTGLMKRGPAYFLLKLVQRQQFRAADIIGVQSPGNLRFLGDWAGERGGRLEVLHNWLTPSPQSSGRETAYFGERGECTVFVYAGNMGQAQGMECLIELAEGFAQRDDVMFLLIGRGSEVPRLRQIANDRSLTNIQFHDEVEPQELPGLLRQCDVGLLALDPRHTTHNIPGKFLAYLDAGLPVLARVNPGNDLIDLIESQAVGLVSAAASGRELVGHARRLLADADLRREMGRRGRELAHRMFVVDRAAKQITTALGERR